jgi:hypothetical protein
VGTGAVPPRRALRDPLRLPVLAGN